MDHVFGINVSQHLHKLTALVPHDAGDLGNGVVGDPLADFPDLKERVIQVFQVKYLVLGCSYINFINTQ